MDDATERWLPIPRYKGLYEVSDFGRVRSVPRITRDGRSIRGRLLRLGRHKHGYLTVNLWRDNRYVTRTVHSLVAEAFLGPRPPGLEVRHLDGDPPNCRLSNLIYGTREENMQDTLRHGTNDRASRTHCPASHEYTADNTAIGRRGDGSAFRICRQCASMTKQRYRDRQKARLTANLTR
jgi:hypothetical protein